MRRVIFISVLSLLVLGFTFYGGEVSAQMGPGMMGPGIMSSGMMGGGMMGRGVMGPGYGGQYGPHCGPQYQQSRKPMEEKDARAMLENYIQFTRNPNLKLGKIEEKNNYFEAEILTKDNSLVDKFTGWMRSMY